MRCDAKLSAARFSPASFHCTASVRHSSPSVCPLPTRPPPYEVPTTPHHHHHHPFSPLRSVLHIHYSAVAHQSPRSSCRRRDIDTIRASSRDHSCCRGLGRLEAHSVVAHCFARRVCGHSFHFLHSILWTTQSAAIFDAFPF